MNNVELARTLSWRESALFEEREKKLSEVAYNPLSFSNGVVNTMCLVKD